MTSSTPEKKRRLSNLFGAKKTKDKDPFPIGTNHDLHPSTSTAATAPQPDSAYASSNHPSSNRDSVSNANAESTNNADVVPVENNGNIEGVGPERNLAYNTSTGQVVDDDTGQVVVTTTTTTTTTMSTRGGKKKTEVEVHTQKDGQPAIAEAPGDMPSMNSETSHSPVPPPQPSSTGISPSSVGSPAPNNNGAQQSYIPPPPRAAPEAFPVPARNPMRDREPMEPVSPLRPNFSYPSRTDIRDDPKPQPSSKSTFANLKAAAQGLHGVGETVRGTLNNEIDMRFPRSNSQKAAAANAKNQSVLDRGNAEMSRVSMRRPSDPRRHEDVPQVPPLRPSSDSRQYQDVPPPTAHEPMPQQLTPGPPPNHMQQHTPPPPTEPANSSVGGFSSHGGSMPSNEMSQVPSSFSPESSAPEQKKGGFRKLIKRRPIGST